MLCNKCQTRNATVHFTTCTGNGDEEPRKIDLCQECFETSDLEEKRFLPVDFQSALRAGCRFCGGEAHSGGMDLVALLGGIRKMSVLCKLCSEEYYGLIKKKLPGFGDPDATKEQMAVITACDFPAIVTELENHMKQWVAKRKSQ